MNFWVHPIFSALYPVLSLQSLNRFSIPSLSVWTIGQAECHLRIYGSVLSYSCPLQTRKPHFRHRTFGWIQGNRNYLSTLPSFNLHNSWITRSEKFKVLRQKSINGNSFSTWGKYRCILYTRWSWYVLFDVPVPFVWYAISILRSDFQGRICVAVIPPCFFTSPNK